MLRRACATGWGIEIVRENRVFDKTLSHFRSVDVGGVLECQSLRGESTRDVVRQQTAAAGVVAFDDHAQARVAAEFEGIGACSRLRIAIDGQLIDDGRQRGADEDGLRAR